MEKDNEQMNRSNKHIWLIYILGIILWLIWWGVVLWYKDYSDRYLFSKWFFISFMIGFAILIINCLLWRKESSYSYDREARATASVERNTSYLILAITIAMMAQQTFIKRGEIFRAPTNFQLWALIFAVLPLALIWIPSNKPNFLVWLRHIKTVLFTYAMSFFIAGIIAFWQGYLLGRV